jgi:hypothetical protein
MEKHEVVWPWGMTERDPDPATRPWVFNPRDFLVAVVEDDAEAERSRLALMELGFAEEDLRSYSGELVLSDRERFLAQQGPLRRVVGQVTSDAEAVKLFVRYAEEGRAFLWVHVHERDDANRAIRGLSSRKVLHFRYYGDTGAEDVRMP